ncbi:PREDICTED: putative ATP synthase subunit f, mitochondrial [Ceratosolen solmsi marchali]|uniref:ATP synthase subunit f, mitochondrial n=2 Tax=Ceratosolen solmsi TaxID=142686 RepID=A0AAJ6YP07_9HYME|nr:PREDICTED: putative ATP synthase subunit f, mitochondrial [Ceratosolen solmsi marchali]AIX97506.1 mitochondrial F chain [Ceratosolen solmsi]
MGFGDYPKEYNPSVHGRYDPSVYYGPKDTAFGDVKLSDLGSWLSRRKYSPPAITAAISRAWWRWQMKYVQPKRTGMAPLYHLLIGAMTFSYAINYKRIKNHRHRKYH